MHVISVSKQNNLLPITLFDMKPQEANLVVCSQPLVVSPKKQCSKCKRWLLLNKFSKDKTRKEGLQCQCKDCVAKYDAAYRKINPKKIIQSITILELQKMLCVCFYFLLLYCSPA